MNTPTRNYTDTLPVGYQLHWYTVESILGRGGSGVTYLAKDTNLNIQVAIKEYFPAEISSRDSTHTVHASTTEDGELYAWGLDRFIKEAQILASFKHQNIARVMSVFQHNNTAYLIMEYEKGLPLSQLLKSRTYSHKELIDIFIPVIEGLKLVHGAEFIHRDIKPSNIYIRDDGSPVLIDFGAARKASGRTKVQQLTTVLTYGYAPFEQYSDTNEKQGPWTDIYSLAATLYLATTGKIPPDAMKRGTSLLSSQADPYIRAYNQASGDCSEGFLKAIDYGLQFQPQDRPQNLQQWQDALLEHTPVPNLSDATVVIRPQRKPNSAPPTGHSEAKTPAPKKSSPVLIIAIVGLTLSILVGAYVFSTQDATPESQKVAVIAEPAPAPAPAPIPAPAEEIAPPIIEPQVNTKLNSHLAMAKELHESGQLYTARGISAWSKYNQALEEEPGNKTAEKGLNDIIKHYTEQTRAALNDENIALASKHIETLNRIAKTKPETKRLIEARDQLLANIRINRILKQASQSLEQNKYSKPSNDNILYYLSLLDKETMLSSQNKSAIKAMERDVSNTLQSLLKQHKKQAADNILKTAKTLRANNAHTRALEKSVSNYKPKPPPAVETLAAFAQALRNRDLATLNKISDYKPQRQNFLNTFMRQYVSYKVSISKINDTSASVELYELVNNQGDSVEAGPWSQFSITMKLDDTNTWKVIW